MKDVKKQLFFSIILVFLFIPSFTIIVQAEETYDVSTVNQSKASIILTTPNQKNNKGNEDHPTEEIDMSLKPEGRLNQKKPFGRLPNTGDYSRPLGMIVGYGLLFVVFVCSLKKRQM